MGIDIGFWIDHWLGHALTLVCIAPGLVLIAWGVWRWRVASHRAAGERFCPGPRTWRRWTHPKRWLSPIACGYPLAGREGGEGGSGTLPRHAPDVVRCPECGSLQRVSRAARTDLGLRLERPGVALVALGLLLATTGFVRDGRWIARLPNVALVATKRLAGSHTPPRIESEIQERLMDRRLVPTPVFSSSPAPLDWTTRALIDALVQDLASDTQDHNAMQAVWQLRSIGLWSIPALRKALDSPDWQQRQLAAYALRELRDDPSEALLRVSVEALQDDALPYGSDHMTDFSNANQSAPYLIEFARLAEPMLAQAMESSDTQQRWLAACIAGLAHREALADRAVPVLFDHLGDNHIAFDAKHCLAALCHYGAGPKGVGASEAVQGRILREAAARWDDPDPQTRAACELLLLILDPPPGQRARERREAVQNLWRRFDESGQTASPLEVGGVYLAW